MINLYPSFLRILEISLKDIVLDENITKFLDLLAILEPVKN